MTQTAKFKTQFIYLHGFNSGFNPDAMKSQQLAELSGSPIVGFSINYLNPIEVQQLKDLISNCITEFDGETIIVGTSLGGYFARYFSNRFSTRCILLNPAVKPYNSLMRAVGSQTNYFTGEEYTVHSASIADLVLYETQDVPDTLMILAYDDEVIPYELPRDAYPECKAVLTLGGHRLKDLNSVSAEITAFINRLPASDTIF